LTYRDVFEPQVGNSSEVLLRQRQHILTPIDPKEFSIWDLLMQEGEQHPCSTGHIQQAWSALLFSV